MVEKYMKNEEQICKQQKHWLDLCIKREFEMTLQEKKTMKSEYEHIQNVFNECW